MTKLSETTATDHIELDSITGHYGTIGDFTVGFETYHHDDDPSPLFRGLPEDSCQARHWGVVLEGKLVFRYTDGAEDVIEAGEAYYARPGHLPVFCANSRAIEFTPTEEMAATMAVVEKNLAALHAG